jgi:hypothetical protein
VRHAGCRETGAFIYRRTRCVLWLAAADDRPPPAAGGTGKSWLSRIPFENTYFYVYTRVGLEGYNRTIARGREWGLPAPCCCWPYSCRAAVHARLLNQEAVICTPHTDPGGIAAESPSGLERSARFPARRYDSSGPHKKSSDFQEFLGDPTRESRIVLQKAITQVVCACRRPLSAYV